MIKSYYIDLLPDEAREILRKIVRSTTKDLTLDETIDLISKNLNTNEIFIDKVFDLQVVPAYLDYFTVKLLGKSIDQCTYDEQKSMFTRLLLLNDIRYKAYDLLNNSIALTANNKAVSFDDLFSRFHGSCMNYDKIDCQSDDEVIQDFCMYYHTDTFKTTVAIDFLDFTTAHEAADYDTSHETIQSLYDQLDEWLSRDDEWLVYNKRTRDYVLVQANDMWDSVSDGKNPCNYLRVYNTDKYCQHEEMFVALCNGEIHYILPLMRP